MVIVEFSINPLDTGGSIAKPVSRAIDIISTSGLSYEVGAVGTTIEGELDEVMDLLTECIEDLSRHSERVTFSIQGDFRKDDYPRLKKNVKRVEQTLGRDLK
jgi:uncharacterized protein (TIGR00106 family)